MISGPDRGEKGRGARTVAERPPAGVEPLPSEAMAQIGRLVAIIKAERHADRIAQPSIESSERDQLVALLRRFVAAREQERHAWEETLRRTKAELAQAQAMAATAQARLAQEESRYQRALADLELLHEHQRSIWTLDRRRLEITIEGLSEARAVKGRRKRVQLAAGIAAVLCMGIIGLALAGSRTSGETGAPRRVIDSIRALSPGELSCLIGCERSPEPVQQGRL